MLKKIRRNIVRRSMGLYFQNITKLVSGLALAYTVSIMPAYSQQIVIDGKTNTSLSTSGVTTNISTSTVKGSNAFNSFSKFNVDSGKTVNLIVPSSSKNLINLVHDEATNINGILNSIQDGAVGGNIFLVNPNGITVGSQGVINVGSLTAVTPTKDFTDNFFLAPGQVNDYSVEALLSGSAPVNPDALINVEGKINAIGNVTLDTGSFTSSGKIQSGAVFKENSIESGDIVNLSDIEEGTSVTNVAGEISIKADYVGLDSSSVIAAKGINSTGGDISISGSFVAIGGIVDSSGTSGGSVNINSNLLSLAGEVKSQGSIGAGGIVNFDVAGKTFETSSSFIDVSGATGGSISHIAGQQITTSGHYSARGNSGDGGSIYLTAPVTKLLSTKIDASGQTGGGEILLGGEYQGGKNLEVDLIPNAETLIINGGTEIKANATGTSGDGGKIIAWADNETIVLGNFEAIPGTVSGNGGLVEVSSGDKATFDGMVQTGYGDRLGNFLLDPKNIIIASGGSYLEYDLTIGYNYEISPNLASDDGFGLSLSLDGTRLAIGSFHDDGFGDGNSNSGAVYLYSFSDEAFNGGTLEGIMGSGYTGGKNYNQTLDSGDEFGCSVSLDGTMLAIGAEYDKGADNTTTARGAVYLYTFSDQAFTNPTLQGIIGDGYTGAKDYDLTLYNSDYFGYSLNLNNNRLVVGATGDAGFDNTAFYNYSGAAYLFTFTDSTFSGATLQATIGKNYTGAKNIDLALDGGDYFGSSVSLDGNRLVVGVSADDGVANDNSYAGAVYMFTFTDSSFSGGALQGIIGSGYTGSKNIDQTLLSSSFLGGSISLEGTKIAVGAYGVDSYTGAVYIYNFTDESFSGGSLESKIGNGYTGGNNYNQALDSGDYFGTSVCLDNGRLAVGAYMDDGYENSLSSSGAVYLYTLGGSSISAKLFADQPSDDVTISTGSLISLLSTPQNVTLQANNDITISNDIIVNNASGNGGVLTLQAGRSILINANITTDNANLILIGNELLANGVVNAYRDSGNAVITMNSSSTINAGSGDVTIDLRAGTGKTYTASGDITLNNITAGSILITNNGTTAGSDIVINSGAALNASDSGNSLVLSSANGTFTNNSNGSALSSGGRWLVYADNPTNITIGGLSASKVYNKTYAANAPATITQTGNRFLYSKSATLTITAADKSRAYGDLNPAFTYSVSGYEDGDTSANAFSGDPSLTTTATQSSNVGSYTITSALGTLVSDYGYNFSYANAGLTINQASLTVTADDKSKAYGSVNPALSASYSGFVLGQNSSDLGGSLNLTTAADQNSIVGDYGITASGYTSGNYNISYTDGTLTVNKADLAVNIDDKTKTYGDINPAFTSSYSGFVLGQNSSVLGGSLSLASVATQSSDAGVYAITGSGLTSGNYNIVYNNGDLTINKADLTVTADDKSKAYGAANPAFTASYTGFVLGQDSSVLGGSISTAAVQASDAGSYAITGSTLTSGNYNIISNDGTLTINKVDLTVTADDKTKTYGAVNPALTASYTGFVLGQDSSDLGGALNLATLADQNSNAGTYAIAPSGYASSNYNISYANGTLTIDKADLTVTADDKTKTYGAVNPALTASYSGFVLGQNESVLGGSLDLSTSATQTSNAGDYGITASGYTSGNYNISYTDGTLAINKADLTVDVDDKSRTYGSVNPELSASYTGFVLGQDSSVLGGSISTAAVQASDAGSYAITGSTLTSGNYNIISNDGTLTVNKADLTVTADDKTKTYGDLNPALTASYSGFVLGQDSSDLGGALNLATLADQNSNAGTYAIAPSGYASSNYNISYANGTLTIDKATLTITADDKSKTYGSVNPEFTATYSGFKLGQNKTDLGGSETFFTLANQNSDAGTYTINVLGLSSSNYLIYYYAGDLTINKADLTVTADNKAKTYGAVNPALTASYSGFVLGQNESVLGGSLDLSTAATQTSNAGDYGITASGYTSGNYNISYTDGTLAINKADLTVDVDDKSRTYGTVNPALTASYTGFVLGQDSSVLGGSITSAAVQASDAGSYAITGSTLTSGNYNIISNDGTLTVNKADLTVTADDKAKTYGSVNPALTASYSGFVLGQDSSDLGGALNLATLADQNSNAGTYAIAPSGYASSNYNISYANGTLTIDKADLTVTADNKAKTYGAVNPALTASYSGFVLGQNESVLGGSLDLSTAATQTSNAGDYGITASGYTSGNYNISYTDGTLAINKADLTVDVDDKSRTYGSVNPELTASYTGFVLGQDSSVLGGSISTAATQSSDAGSYAITGSTLTSGNYNIISNDGTLTVNKADLTVTADDKAKIYGSVNPELTASYSGFVLSQDPSDLGGNLNLATLADQNSNAGTFAITPSGYTSSNYNISYIDGTLTVNKAALTVTADDKAKTYGDINPALTASYSGFVLGQDESVLGGSLDLSTAATQTSNAGDYGITASGYTSGNYNISYTDGTLAIDKANLTVNVDNKSRTYGAVNPAFTAIYSGFVLGQNKSVLGGSISTVATQSSNVGTYAITGSTLISNNYNITANDGILTVNKANLTVDVDDKSRIYGTANPAFTASYNGFVLGQNKTVLGGSITTTAQQSSPEGEYPITADTLTSSNYNIISNDGLLTVTPVQNPDIIEEERRSVVEVQRDINVVNTNFVDSSANSNNPPTGGQGMQGSSGAEGGSGNQPQSGGDALNPSQPLVSSSGSSGQPPTSGGQPGDSGQGEQGSVNSGGLVNGSGDLSMFDLGGSGDSLVIGNRNYIQLINDVIKNDESLANNPELLQRCINESVDKFNKLYSETSGEGITLDMVRELTLETINQMSGQ